MSKNMTICLTNDSKERDYYLQPPVQVDGSIEKNNTNAVSVSIVPKQPTKSAGTEIKGHLFESKLLTLFMIRALSAGNEFELAVNNEEIGGKFDDLIFRYLDQENTLDCVEKNWTYRYLQAKHKTDKTKFEITAASLFSQSATAEVEEGNIKDKDYSLFKYFQSYCKLKARGDNIHDCIICTNINFKNSEMKEIQLKPVDNSSENILNFKTHNNPLEKNIITSFKLEFPEVIMKKFLKKMVEISDMQALTNQLKKHIENKHCSPSLKIDILGKYHIALIKEKILEMCDEQNPAMLRFHRDFISNKNLSTRAQLLRTNLSSFENNEMKKWKFQCPGKFGKPSSEYEMQELPECVTCENVKDFLGKLIFVVNMPNEEQLSSIICCDIKKYYSQNDAESQSLRVLNEVLDWFKSVKSKESEWLSSKIGKKILLDGVTKQSIEFRNQLMTEVGYNENSVEVMTGKIEQMFNSNLRFMHISTQTPKWTAAKIISAIETLPKYGKSGGDSYWVISSNCLLQENAKELWKNRLELVSKDFGHLLLVVVDEVNHDATTLIPDDSTWKNKVIIVTKAEHEESIKDNVNFEDLNHETQTKILSRTVSFQGKDMAIRDLINSSETHDVLNSVSIEELMDDKKHVEISWTSCSSSFDPSIYIDRSLSFGTDHQLFKELARELDCSTEELERECKFDEKGEIQWLVKDGNQITKIWEKLKVILECKKTSSANRLLGKIIPEHKLLQSNRVILTGVAGTGKSTVLFNYYEQIKSKNPDWWTMKINLVEHSKFLSNFEVENPENPDRVIDILVNEQCTASFARSLLTNRLKTGDRMVLMLDGFDEIDDKCQDVVIKGINSLNKSVKLYVATRPHMTDKLQSELLQPAYSLVIFNEHQQVKYLTSIWKKYLKKNRTLTDFTEKIIQKFATSLVKHVSSTLNDQERNFIGIPLQCQILAECFQSNVQQLIIQQGTENPETVSLNDSFNPLDGQNFNLASLYKLLMQTKHKVFCEEKMKFDRDNLIVNYSMKMTTKQIEFHLTKLAIKAIVTKKEDVAILWPGVEFESVRFQSEEDWREEVKILDELCIRFGLLDRNKEGKMQFLHRTYAEYLVADYIYKGFLLDGQQHNRLLENEEVRLLIAKKILVNDKYRGVLVFLDSMLKDILIAPMGKRRRKSDVNIPDRWQQLVINLTQEGFLLNKLSRNKYINVFKFIFDCLDATFIPSKVRSIISRRPISSNNFFVIERLIHLHQDNEMFKRLLAYYDDTIDDEWKEMFISLCNSSMSRKRKLIINQGPSIKMNIKHVIDLVKTHRECFITLAMNRDEKSKKAISNFVKFLIHNPDWNDLLQEFIETLLSFYPESPNLVMMILKDAITFYYRDPSRKGSISTSTLEIIKLLLTFPEDLISRNEMNNIIWEILYVFLQHEPEIFTNFFKKDRPKEEMNNGSTDTVTDSLVVSDSWGMTPLHQITDLYGDTDTGKQILNSFLKRLSDHNAAKAREENKLVPYHPTNTDNIVNPNYDYTSILYAAFVTCFNEQMGHKIFLSFLKQSSSIHKLLQVYTDKNGCLYHSTEHTSEITTESSVEIVETNFDQQFNYFNIIRDLFVYNKDPYSIYVQALLKYVETEIVQRVVATEQFDNWFQKLLHDHHFFLKVSIPTINFFNLVSEDCRSDLVRILVTKQFKSTYNKKSTYWTHHICNHTKMAINFMKCTSKVLRENDFKKLLLHEDDYGLVLVQAMMLKKGVNAKEIETMLECLPQEMQLEFRRCFTEQGIRQFDEELIFNKKQQISTTFLDWKHLHFLQIFFYYGNKDELLKFVKTITTICVTEPKKCSLWDYILKGKKMYRIDDIEKFIRCVSDRLGENAVMDLLFIQVDHGSLILRPSLINYAWTVEAIGAQLSKKTKNEIRQRVLTAPGMIEKMLSDRKWKQSIEHYYLAMDCKGIAKNLLDGFNLLILHFIDKFDKIQLQKFIKLISTVKRFDGRANSRVHYSIWFDYVDKACKDGNLLSENVKSIRKFLKSIHLELGESCVKSLVFHKKNGKDDDVSIHAATSGNIRIFEALISQFDEKRQFLIRNNAFTRLKVVRNTLTKNGIENLVCFYLAEINKQEQNIRINLLAAFNILFGFFIESLDRDKLNYFIQLILSADAFNNCCPWSKYISRMFPNKRYRQKKNISIEASVQCASRWWMSSEGNSVTKNTVPRSVDSPNGISTSIKTTKYFLKCVEKHLGNTTVRRLLFFEDVNGIVIERVMETSKTQHSKQILHTMLNYL